jgi:hypothetical protein
VCLCLALDGYHGGRVDGEGCWDVDLYAGHLVTATVPTDVPDRQGHGDLNADRGRKG